MIYGYARVSTTTQGRDGNSLEDQVSALEKYGCQEIVKEAFTGKTMERPKFLSLLEQGKTYRQITTMTGISKSTLIRAKRET